MDEFPPSQLVQKIQNGEESSKMGPGWLGNSLITVSFGGGKKQTLFFFPCLISFIPGFSTVRRLPRLCRDLVSFPSAPGKLGTLGGSGSPTVLHMQSLFSKSMKLGNKLKADHFISYATKNMYQGFKICSRSLSSMKRRGVKNRWGQRDARRISTSRYYRYFWPVFESYSFCLWAISSSYCPNNTQFKN